MVLAMIGLMAIPATAANAARPKAGSPMRPVVMAPNIEGSANFTNYCGGIKCETYLELQMLHNGEWTLVNFSRESNQFGVQTVEAEGISHATYRTAVIDFVEVSTPTACGPASKWIGGVRYKRYMCLPGTTLYSKTWVSASKTYPTII